jgi:hypothetical protein
MNDNGIFLIIILWMLTLVMGVLIGIRATIRDLEWVQKEWKRMERKSNPVGPTQGSYKTRAEANKPAIHVVTAKSPAQVQWEADNVKPDLVKPR